MKTIRVHSARTIPPYKNALQSYKTISSEEEGFLYFDVNGLPVLDAVGPQGPAGPAGEDGTDGEDGAQGPQGDPGIDGEDGAQGIQGNPGSNGADGKTVLNGTIDPTGGDGVNGDFWINTVSDYIFGPKASGTWPAGVSLVGPAGAAGADGADGEDGAPQTPASSVTFETSYGITPATGVSLNYARQDHTHGSPTAPTAASVGADPAGTASTADAAHVAASDPHPQYALEASLGGAASLNVGTAPGTVAAGDQAAGGDASGTLAALTVVKARGLRETSGPTTLTMGAVADGQTLKRVGSTVVGAWIALAYATAPMVEIDAPGAQMGGYTTGAGTVA